MSATPDDTFTNPEQRIADLQRQLAASNAERDEALAREVALAEVLQVINSSPGDLAPVFQAMLEKAVQLCAAAHGSVRIFDGEAFHLAATDAGERFAERARQLGPIVPYQGHPMAPLIAGERVAHVADARETPIYHTDAAVRQRVDAAGVRSWLAVALRKNETLQGAILLHREEVRPFTEKDIALVENFAAQAVIAMENARLLTETREALEQQTATAEVLEVINSSPGDLAPVFDAMLGRALALCDASTGGLRTYDGERFHIAASHGETPAFVEFTRNFTDVAGPLSGLGRIAAGEVLVHIIDIADEEAYRRRDPQRVATVELLGARTCLWVSLRKDNVLLGILYAYRQEVRPFTDKQIALLQNFAAQAVIAMENARLLTETREALEQQTATAEVLQVINSSPGDLAPVFDAMLDKATRLCEANFGIMNTYDGERFVLVAVHGVPPALEEVLGRAAPPPSPR